MMMNTNTSSISIANDLEMWYSYGVKCPITVDISSGKNCHMLICGSSGSGKSYCELEILGRLIEATPHGKFLFADFKQEDNFSFLRNCKNYFPYEQVSKALDEIYLIMHQRQSGADQTRYPVTLVLDEYAAYIQSLLCKDKKLASAEMGKVAELLMLGRSMNLRILTSVQRPDAELFPKGARNNYAVILLLGTPLKSTTEMLLPSSEYIDQIGNRQFQTGEGIAFLQGRELRFIKVPVIRNMEKLKEICIKALST